MSVKFLRRVRSGGGSLEVAIPPAVAEAIGLKPRDPVHIYIVKGKIVIEREVKSR